MKRHPEKYHDQIHDYQRNDPVFLFFRGHHFFRNSRIGDLFCHQCRRRPIRRLSQFESDKGKKHAGRRCTETRVVTKLRSDAVPQKGCRYRGKKCTYIDSHIENIISRVFQRAVFFIQVANHDRNVGLEQSVTHGDHKQPDEKKQFRRFRNGENTVSDTRQYGPDRNRFRKPKELIRNVTSQHRGKVDQCQKQSVYLALLVIRPPEVMSHIQCENREHGVNAKPLPHFRKEKNFQSFRMAFEHSCSLSKWIAEYSR